MSAVAPPPLAATPEYSAARGHAYVEMFSRHASVDLIRNARTTVQALTAGASILPATVDDYFPGNSYIVSPTNAYAEYAAAETHLLGSAALRVTANVLIKAVGGILRSVRLDRVVHVNNWMLSTNLYPELLDGDVSTVTNALIAGNPDRAITFRSLNEFSNAGLLKAFRRAGYVLVPSRRVYIHDARLGKDSALAQRHNVSIDARLLDQSEYQAVYLEKFVDSSVFARIERLYTQLYLEKYPIFNPQYTRVWLENGFHGRWLRFVVLQKPDGQIDGVVGFFENDSTITAPIVGYDTTLPKRLGLYRMLTWLCLREAMTRKVVLNFSSGAAEFKRLRGGIPYTEYSAVYCAHLPRPRRAAWHALAQLLERFAIPLMIHYEL